MTPESTPANAVPLVHSYDVRDRFRQYANVPIDMTCIQIYQNQNSPFTYIDRLLSQPCKPLQSCHTRA
jgi:hypothetical protein